MSGVCGRAEKSGVKQAAKTQSVSAQRPGGQGSAKDPEVGFGEAGSQTVRCGPFRLCGRRWVPGEAQWVRLWGRALGGLCELCGQGQRWAAKQDHAGGVWVPADPAGCVDRGDHVDGVSLRWACGFGCATQARAGGSHSRHTGLELIVCGRGFEAGGAGVLYRALWAGLPTRLPALAPCTFGYFMSARKAWRSVVPTVSEPPKSRLCVVISRVSMWKWLSGPCFSCGG